jgi:hypothetical protein
MELQQVIFNVGQCSSHPHPPRPLLPPKREKGSQDLSVAWPAGGHEVRANGSRKEAKKTVPNKVATPLLFSGKRRGAKRFQSAMLVENGFVVVRLVQQSD